MNAFPVKKLGEVCEIRNGATPDTGDLANWDGPHAWITPAEMGNLESPEVAATRRTLTDKGLATCSASLAPVNSVILSSRAPIGHLVINAVPMATNQGCKTLVPGNQVDYRYLFYFLRANVALLDSLGTGATFRELSAGKLRDVEIPVPPLDEQKRIAAKLDQVVAAERRLEDVAKTARSRCAQLRQQLTVDRMVGSGPLVELGELCEVLDSIRKPITKKDRTPGHIPYYGATGVVDYVTGYIFDEELVLLGEDGAKWGAGEKSAFAISGKAWVNNHAHVLRPKRERVRDQWLIEYLNAADLTDYVTGLTVPKLNQAQMRTIKVPTPTLRVQDEILDTLGGVYQATDHFEAVSTRRLCLSVNLRQSLLEAAFRGEL